MYFLITLQVVFWGYFALYALKFALSKRRHTKTPPQAKQALKTENKKPLDFGGAKYYCVEWNLKTGEVVEEVRD